MMVLSHHDACLVDSLLNTGCPVWGDKAWNKEALSRLHSAEGTANEERIPVDKTFGVIKDEHWQYWHELKADVFCLNDISTPDNRPPDWRLLGKAWIDFSRWADG